VLSFHGLSPDSLHRSESGPNNTPELCPAVRIIFENAAMGCRDGAAARLPDTSDGHAHLFEVQQHGNALRFEHLVDEVGDLFGEPFL
jgi:hypothetical protein